MIFWILLVILLVITNGATLLDGFLKKRIIQNLREAINDCDKFGYNMFGSDVDEVSRTKKTKKFELKFDKNQRFSVTGKRFFAEYIPRRYGDKLYANSEGKVYYRQLVELLENDERVYNMSIQIDKKHSCWSDTLFGFLLSTDEGFAVAYDDLLSAMEGFELENMAYINGLVQKCFDAYAKNRREVIDLLEEIYCSYDDELKQRNTHAWKVLYFLMDDNRRLLSGLEEFIVTIRKFIAQTKHDETSVHITDMTAVTELKTLSGLIEKVQNGESVDELIATATGLAKSSLEEEGAKKAKTLLETTLQPLGTLDKPAPTLDLDNVPKIVVNEGKT